MKIEITSNAYLKLRYFILECPVEISGFGKVREVQREVTAEIAEDIDDQSWWQKTKWGKQPESGTIMETETYLEIYDIEILKQVVSGVHATMSEETLVNFLMDKMRKGQSTKDYKVWWHSHCDMEAYFSPVDTNTIDNSNEFPYLISLVGNHKGDLQCRLDIKKPVAFSSPFELIVQPPKNEEIRKYCKNQIKNKVKVAAQQTYVPPKPGFGFTYNEILNENGWPPVNQVNLDDDFPKPRAIKEYRHKLIDQSDIMDDY